MPPKLIIVCLGNEPQAFGPFDTQKDVEDELDMHIAADQPREGYCPNNITREDHHVLQLLKGFFDTWAEQ